MNRGALWQDEGSERRASSELERKPRFKETINEIHLLYSSLFWNFNKRPNLISRLVLSLFLLLPPVFSRLDVFSLLFHRLDAKPNLSRSKCFPLIRLDLALHIVPRIQYLGFTTQGKKGPLTTTGDLSACKSKRTLIRQSTVNKPLFLAPLPGNKQSRSNLVSLSCEYFLFPVFLLTFLLHLLTLIILKKNK